MWILNISQLYIPPRLVQGIAFASFTEPSDQELLNYLNELNYCQLPQLRLLYCTSPSSAASQQFRVCVSAAWCASSPHMSGFAPDGLPLTTDVTSTANCGHWVLLQPAAEIICHSKRCNCIVKQHNALKLRATYYMQNLLYQYQALHFAHILCLCVLYGTRN
jgi:hypothetical protein